VETQMKMKSRIITETRFRYIRYADNWIIGLTGSVELAEKIKLDTLKFINNELKLDLTLDKTRITNLLHDKAKFLGFYIMINKVKESNYDNGRIRKTNIANNNMWLLVPVDLLLQKLADKGFLKNYKLGHRIVPNAKTSWIYLDHRSIIQQYNIIIQGLLNYYNIATNRYIFHLIINFILRHSCAKTLARKFRLRSRAGAFKKFGPLLKNKSLNPIGLKIEDNYKKWNFTEWNKHIKDSLPEVPLRNKHTGLNTCMNKKKKSVVMVINKK
jgi:hypothetical protein